MTGMSGKQQEIRNGIKIDRHDRQAKGCFSLSRFSADLLGDREYDRFEDAEKWSGQRDSNSRLLAPKASALPTALCPAVKYHRFITLRSKGRFPVSGEKERSSASSGKEYTPYLCKSKTKIEFFKNFSCLLIAEQTRHSGGYAKNVSLTKRM